MHEEVLQEQARIREEIKGLSRRVDEQGALVRSVYELATSVKLLTRAQENTERKVDRLACDVEEIKLKPAKRYDTLLVSALSTLLGAMIAGLLRLTGI